MLANFFFLFYVAQAERRRLGGEGKEYRNPYDFSPWHNWCLFLGAIEGRGLLRCVLLPSAHPPRGDGLEWDSVYGCDVRWNDPGFFPGRGGRRRD